jgi:REP element-mobilizing transposase RayT
MSNWVHAPIRSAHGTPLFRTWEEAKLLWDLLTTRFEVIALVLMPDHVHVLCREEDLPYVKAAIQSYARARNARRGTSGRVWRHGENVTPVKSAKQLHVVVAYIHRNPVWDGLVDDPLAWPFSTHRDAVGLAIPAARRSTKDPERLHETVSRIPGRPGEKIQGLPPCRSWTSGDSRLRLPTIGDAVSALTRTTRSAIRQRGEPRRLLLRSAKCLNGASAREIARFAGVSKATVSRAPATRSREVSLVERVLEDPRFCPLADGDLGSHGWWDRYFRSRPH